MAKLYNILMLSFAFGIMLTTPFKLAYSQTPQEEAAIVEMLEPLVAAGGANQFSRAAQWPNDPIDVVMLNDGRSRWEATATPPRT